MAVQDAHIETNPLVGLHRVLVLVLKDAYFHVQLASTSQTLKDFRFQGGRLPVHSPSIPTVSGSVYLYEVHECETEGSMHPEMHPELS